MNLRVVAGAALAALAVAPAGADEALDRELYLAALWAACFGRSDEVFDLLVTNRASVTAVDAKGNAILIYAADLGRAAPVKALLARGAAVDARTATRP